MYKMILFLLVATVSLFGVSINPANVNKYEITITKLELKKDDGSYITIFSGSQKVDIASANAGEVAGGLVAGVALPDGNYTHVRATVSNTFVINACDSAPTTGNCTDNNHTVNAALDDVQVNNPVDSTLTITAIPPVETALSFSVVDGVCSLAGGMSISFNLTGAVQYETGAGNCFGAGGECIYPATPGISISKN